MSLGSRRERNGARLRRRFKVMLEHSPSFTVDVGLQGFCLELLRVLPPGSPVEGTVQMKRADVPFAGRVVWAKSGDASLGLRGRMGVAFTRVAPEYAEQLSVEGTAPGGAHGAPGGKSR